MTFGQVFAAGDVAAGESLVALIDGQAVPLQVDVKATHPDGSIRHAILSLQAPALGAGEAVEVMLAKGPAATQPALDVADILGAGYDVELVVDGQTIAVADLLAQALADGSATPWLSGPLASEVRIEAPISADGNLHATFDIRVQADGSVRTDVALAYDWAYSMGMDNITYDVAIKNNGETVVHYDDLEQNHHSTWHQEVWSDGAPGLNVVRDVPYLVQTGAVPGYDTSIAIDGAALDEELAKLAKADTGPMGNALVEMAMPNTGGRFDIGPTTTWNARYLLSQDARALEVMLANADAAGSIPWHFRDNATGEYVRIDDHPQLWIDYRGVGGRYGNDQLPEKYSADGTGWHPDAQHQPALSYLPYLFTGSRYYLDELQAQTAYTIAWFNPAYRGEEDGIVDSSEVRAKAWSLRTIADAAYITPDDNALKAYFEQILDNNLEHFFQKYVVGGAMDAAGEVEGWVPGLVKAGYTAGWQTDFMTIIMSELAQRGHEQAEAMLDWMANFVAGRFINGENGFDPLQGATYLLKVFDPETGEKYSTWEEVFQHTFPNGAPDGSNLHLNYAFGYQSIAKGALASLISATGSPEAVEAYGYVVSETTKSWDKYDTDPTWNIAPKLADGSYLLHSDIHLGSGTVNGTARNELLHGRANADVISGGGGIDLLYGGGGNDTIDGGAGDDYLFGNAGKDLLRGGAGDDVLKGNAGGDVFVYDAAQSGHDVILDFEIGTDRLNVAEGLVSATALLAGATADADGNAVLHLGPDSSITLIGVNPNELEVTTIAADP